MREKRKERASGWKARSFRGGGKDNGAESESGHDEIGFEWPVLEIRRLCVRCRRRLGRLQVV